MVTRDQNSFMKSRISVPLWLSACLSIFFPILSFCATNYRFVTLKAVLTITALSLVAVLIVYLAVYLLLHDRNKSALAAMLAAVYFYSYGHLRIFLLQTDNPLKKQYLLLPITLLLVGFILWQVIRAKSVAPAVIQIFNVVFVTLTLFSAGNLLAKIIHEKQISESVSATARESASAAYGERPDVYILLMDEYARQDELKNIGNFDNGAFIQELKDLNFAIPTCSHSNYYWSIQSMSSMFNLNYINVTTQPLGTVIQTNLQYDQVIWNLKHSLIRIQLEQRGYKTVAFETGFPWSEVNDADIFYRADTDAIRLTPFTSAFLDTTLYSALAPVKRMLAQNSAEPEADVFATNTPEFYYAVKMNTFDRLDQITSTDSPRFVFAHILSVHTPYVWDEQGTFSNSLENTPANYVRQIPYHNERMLAIIENILAKSANPPIILLLSDHGYRSKDQPVEQGFNNFIAVYGPDDLKSQMYDTITPVNLFRLVYNELFDGNYELLPDDQFHSADESDNSPFVQVSGYCPR
jgi:uncharacterized membrane protein